MSDKANLAYAADRAERKDVLLDFGGEAFAHLHDISFRLVFIALREQDDRVGVLEGDLILKEAHIVVVALEAVNHDEQVDAHIARVDGARVFVVRRHYLLFADFVCALDSLNEDGVVVDAVAFFKDDRTYLSKRLLQAFGLNLQLQVA